MSLDKRSKDLRKVIVQTLQAANRGHVGAALSLVEIFRVLYDDILTYDPKRPNWKNRDRCILSKGHGCLALYTLLAEKGFFPQEEMMKFCKFDGLLGGHPEITVPGVEASTGSLGHGLSIGIGMAISAKYEKQNHRVFVVTGDGECNEGSIWEAALCAGKHKLDNLTVIVDYNKHQSYSSTFEVQDLEPFADKWKAFGFAVQECDGHNVSALQEKLKAVPFEQEKPSALICHTTKGRGLKDAENNMKWHHKNSFTDDEVNGLMTELETSDA